MTQTVQQLVDSAKQRITEIDVATLKETIASMPLIIDVREPSEYQSGHIFGAINIPRGMLEFQVDGHPAIAQKLTPGLNLRNAPVYLYCRSGGRSALAADVLQTLGFERVYSVSGGVLAWEAAGFTLQN